MILSHAKTDYSLCVHSLMRMQAHTFILYVLYAVGQLRDYCINRLIGLVGRVFANGPRDQGSITGWVIPKTFLKNGTCYLLALYSES